MRAIRLDVRENRLSSPARVTERDYRPFVEAGSSWAAERDGDVVGVAAAAAADGNVWALFVSPSAEGAGIGRVLHEALIDWATTLNLDRLTLTTAAGTRPRASIHGWDGKGSVSIPTARRASCGEWIGMAAEEPGYRSRAGRHG